MCYYCWGQGNWRIGQAVSAWLDDPIPFKAAKRLVRWSSQCVFGCLKIAISRISAPFPLHKYVRYTFFSRLHISSLFSRRFSNPNWIKMIPALKALAQRLLPVPTATPKVAAASRHGESLRPTSWNGMTGIWRVNGEYNMGWQYGISKYVSGMTGIRKCWVDVPSNIIVARGWTEGMYLW